MPRSIRAIWNARSALPDSARSLPASGSRLVVHASLPELALAVMASTLVLTIWAWTPAYLVFTVDDAFYYLEAARNLAQGFGWTFDRIEPTDGFHPLWLYVLAASCRLLEAGGAASPATLMRLILSFQVVMVVVAVRSLARLNALSIPLAPACLAAILFAFYGAKILINGQESALQFALLALALSVFVHGRERASRSPAWALGLGVLSGLCALARLEAALFGLACAAAVLWQGSGTRHTRFRDASLLLAAFTLVFAPYVVHHYVATGHIMPVSGAIKADSTEGLAPLLRVFPALGIGAGALWLARASQTRLLLRQLLPLWAYVIGLQLYLVVARGELVPSIWYCAPHALLAVILLARGVSQERWRQACRRPLALAGLALIVTPMWIYRLLPTSYDRYTIAADLGAWLDRHVSPTARIASWDAGIIGAHTAVTLTNLDGLVNSWDYKLNYLDRRKSDQYLREGGVTHLVQYYSLAMLRGHAPQWRGVDLRDWRVAEARCFDVRRIGSFWRTEQQVFLVLAREGVQPALSDWARGAPCGA